jgi:uncharacterized protein YeaO (DUF488 family)
MTFEELNRAMEFLVEQQARMSTTLDRHIEQTRQDHEWSRGIIRQLAVNNQLMVELIESNSQRLDENDREHRDFVKFQRDFQKESQKQHQEIMAQLRRILERPPQNPNPN